VDRADTDLHYAANFALVSCLQRQGDADKLVQFARRLQDYGPAVGHRQIYELEGEFQSWGVAGARVCIRSE
jgi:hypothetical protein